MQSIETSREAVSRRAAVAAGLAPLVVARHVLGGAGYQAPSDKLRIAAWASAAWAGTIWPAARTKRSSRFATWTTSFPRRCSSIYPRARLYKDFRQMFDKEQKNFDALIVATPDHWHSHLVLAGLAMNKHIYCAKPITHTIAEARRVKAACLASKVTTKASIQDSRTSYARATTELLLTGAIGPIREVHFWTGTHSPSGLARPRSRRRPRG